MEELCKREPTTSRGRARTQDNDCVLTIMYSCPETNISSSSVFPLWVVHYKSRLCTDYSDEDSSRCVAGEDWDVSVLY